MAFSLTLRNGQEPPIVKAVDIHRFQPIQLGSEWVEKVDQLTNWKWLIPNRTHEKPNQLNNPSRLIPIEHDVRVVLNE